MSNLDRLSLCRTRSFLNLEAVLLLFLAATVGWGEESKSLPANQPGPLDKPGVLALSSNPTTEELYRARVFDEPLVPVGGAPTAEENAALAAALVGYAQRSGPDDFSSLTRFLDTH